MNLTRNPLAACLLALATLTAFAQSTALQDVRPTSAPVPASTPRPAIPTPPPPIQINRMTIVLDPSHGGVDSGSRIGESILEKDVTLALAFKLRSLLSARGFTVVMTRDADIGAEPNAAGTPLTLDDRAGLANHARPSACLLIHATGSGSGVHLYSSELEPAPGEPTLQPWLTAQAAWVPQSRQLEKHLATALTRAGVALVSSSASVRPVDSLACPALVVELAPEGDDPDGINDSAYQQKVAQAIAGALVFWPSQAQPPARIAAPSIASTATSTTTAVGPQP